MSYSSLGFVSTVIKRATATAAPRPAAPNPTTIFHGLTIPRPAPIAPVAPAQPILVPAPAPMPTTPTGAPTTITPGATQVAPGPVLYAPGYTPGDGGGGGGGGNTVAGAVTTPTFSPIALVILAGLGFVLLSGRR